MHRGWLVSLAAGSALALACPSLGQTFQRVSVSSTGEQSLGVASGVALSPDGGYVAFTSNAPNLVANDNNATDDVFLRHLASGDTILVSRNAAGGSADGASLSPLVSRDGLFVVFTSSAQDLSPDDTDPYYDVFIFNRLTQSVEVVSVDYQNRDPGLYTNHSFSPVAVSDDGTRVLFYSSVALVPDDTNGKTDAYIRNTVERSTTLVCRTPDGTVLSSECWPLDLSGDGRIVAFSSMGNYTGEVFGPYSHVFLKDLSSGAISAIRGPGGEPPNGSTFIAHLSYTGRYVALHTSATNLAPGGHSMGDQFVWLDRDSQTRKYLASGTVVRDSLALSADGLFVIVNGFSYEQQLHDVAANQKWAVQLEANGRSEAPWLSRDGQVIAFLSAASNITPEDTNNQVDAFIRLLTPPVLNAVTPASGPTRGTAAIVEGEAFEPRQTHVWVGGALVLPTSITNSRINLYLPAAPAGPVDIVVHTPGGAATLTAGFRYVEPQGLTVLREGLGSGLVSSQPAGIACGVLCFVAFDYGTAVLLSAKAAAGSTFMGWSGGGCSGSGPCTVTMDAAQSVTAMFSLVPPISYYLAEGSTSGPFDLDILVANPSAQFAPVGLTFLTGTGRVETLSDSLPPTSRRTYQIGRSHVPALASEGGISTVVESTAGIPLIVERTMFWDKTRYYAGHGGTSVAKPETTWYFGEGSQGFFDTFVLLANSGNTDAQVIVKFLLDDSNGVPFAVPVTVGARTRETLWALAYPELTDKSFSIVVESDVPIIAERAMYLGPRLVWPGGHESAGVPALSTQWFHAEGATGHLFDEYILVGNPNDSDTTVTFTFLLDSGSPVVGTRVVGRQSRFTLNVEAAGLLLDGISQADDQRLKAAAVSVRVEATSPVVSERAMYWPFVWAEAHNSFGVTGTGVKWGLAEGRNGGPLAFDTYILIANPSPQNATIRAMFLMPNGTTTSLLRTVPANSRFNIHPHEMPSGEFGVVIESTNSVPVVVERAMYWTPPGGQWWEGGTNALATKLQ